MSFFPRLYHSQEYAFFFLLAVALCLAWVERINPWIRTPIDLPLLGFVGWVLCTVPFATDPSYSFSEWRKLVVQVLVFYWAMFVLRSHRRIELSRQIIWTVVLGSLVLSGFALVDFVLAWRNMERSSRSCCGSLFGLQLVSDLPGARYSDSHLVGGDPSRVLDARTRDTDSRNWQDSRKLPAYTRAGWVAHFAQAVGFGLDGRTASTGHMGLLWAQLRWGAA